jgi:hypothetical protein
MLTSPVLIGLLVGSLGDEFALHGNSAQPPWPLDCTHQLPVMVSACHSLIGEAVRSGQAQGSIPEPEGM